ncbi:MAG TPA: DUF3488 and transglutaminase-like domain-containing protein [Xanthomonadales bacterium]|nr:DUF3488 and transglutaminase-like domain-containing protein [Xanthomonadales bacterium]
MRSPVLDPRQFEWTLVAFCATLAAHLLLLPIWLSATLIAILLARWLQRRAYARAWPAWIKFPLLLLVMVLVLAAFSNPGARQAGPTAALIGLSTLKLIESERRRDGLLILTVALFLVTVQFLFNDGLGVTLYMVIPTLLIFLALSEVAAPPGTRGGLVAELGSFGRDFLLLMAVVLPLTLFLFLSVPRLSEPLWGNRDNRLQSRTGLSEEMSPGSIIELLADDTPVMRVTFPDGPPPRSSMYWRGPVLWRFDGVTWTISNRFAGAGSMLGSLPGPQSGGPGDLRYQVMLEPTDRNWLHTLDLATGFPADASRSVEGVVTRYRRITRLLAFEASAAVDQPIPLLALAEEQRTAGLQQPRDRNPRTRQLAAQWRAQIGADPMALAEHAMRYIRSENFGYTLSPPPLVGAHRIDEFLFETRLGFCEHYASAFVVLMRSAGVPARVVTGYLGGEYNRVGDYWIVRNSDAHAWTEILVEGRGWIRVDPTAAIAPERIDQSGSAFAGETFGDDIEWLRSLRERVDATRAWWNNAIVRFDSMRQQAFFAELGMDPRNWRHVGAWMGGGLALIGLLTALVFLLQRQREPVDPALRLYRRFLKDLARRGVTAAPNEGASDLGRRASLALPAQAVQIGALVAAYEAARYGVPDADCLTRLRRALAEFRSALRQSRA